VLGSLTILTPEEIDELSTAIQMKPGHKRRFPNVVKKKREEMEEQEEKRQMQKEKQEEKLKREEAKQEREDEEQEILAEELAKLDRERKLQKAKAQVDAEGHSNAGNSMGIQMTVSNSKIESKGMFLPENRSYAAFISHKKAHSKHGDSSETLARSLKVCECVC
jgi:hypothetical protein